MILVFYVCTKPSESSKSTKYCQDYLFCYLEMPPKTKLFDIQQFEEIRNMIKSEIQAACEPVLIKVEETNKKVDLFIVKVESIEKDVSEMKKEIGVLNNEVLKLKSSLNDLEQYSRNCNLEISGIPTSENENLTETLGKIAQLVGFHDDLNIAKIHRVPTRSNKDPKPIICQFNLRSDRDDFLLKARGKKNLNINDLDSNFVPSTFYVNEHLTMQNKYILSKAKQFRRDHQEFKYVWCRDGKVFVRKNENSKAIRIKSDTDLTQLNV